MVRGCMLIFWWMAEVRGEEVIGDLHLRKGGWRCASSSRLDAGRRGRGQGRCERGSSVLSSLFDGCWLRRARS